MSAVYTDPFGIASFFLEIFKKFLVFLDLGPFWDHKGVFWVLEKCAETYKNRVINGF